MCRQSIDIDMICAALALQAWVSPVRSPLGMARLISAEMKAQPGEGLNLAGLNDVKNPFGNRGANSQSSRVKRQAAAYDTRKRAVFTAPSSPPQAGDGLNLAGLNEAKSPFGAPKGGGEQKVRYRQPVAFSPHAQRKTATSAAPAPPANPAASADVMQEAKPAAKPAPPEPAAPSEETVVPSAAKPAPPEPAAPSEETVKPQRKASSVRRAAPLQPGDGLNLAGLNDVKSPFGTPNGGAFALKGRPKQPVAFSPHRRAEHSPAPAQETAPAPKPAPAAEPAAASKPAPAAKPAPPEPAAASEETVKPQRKASSVRRAAPLQPGDGLNLAGLNDVKSPFGTPEGAYRGTYVQKGRAKAFSPMASSPNAPREPTSPPAVSSREPLKVAKSAPRRRAATSGPAPLGPATTGRGTDMGEGLNNAGLNEARNPFGTTEGAYRGAYAYPPKNRISVYREE